MEFAKIVAYGLFAAIAYGVIHDQVTARVCLEYFAIGHPALIRTSSPTLLALAWAFVATWWVGIPLGVIIAMAARHGGRPKLSAAQVRPYILSLMPVVGALALTSGFLAYLLAKRGAIALSKDWSDLLPEGTQIQFLVDVWSHSASYLFGILGGAVAAVLIYRRRTT